MASLHENLAALDWRAAAESLSARGYAVTTPLLTPDECKSIVDLYPDEKRFRSHIIMGPGPGGAGGRLY